MIDILKCCPFCGALELRLNSPVTRIVWVSCALCGSTGSDAETREEAISNWNERKPDLEPARFISEDGCAPF